MIDWMKVMRYLDMGQSYYRDRLGIQENVINDGHIMDKAGCLDNAHTKIFIDSKLCRSRFVPQCFTLTFT